MHRTLLVRAFEVVVLGKLSCRSCVRSFIEPGVDMRKSYDKTVQEKPYENQARQ